MEQRQMISVFNQRQTKVLVIFLLIATYRNVKAKCAFSVGFEFGLPTSISRPPRK